MVGLLVWGRRGPSLPSPIYTYNYICFAANRCQSSWLVLKPAPITETGPIPGGCAPASPMPSQPGAAPLQAPCQATWLGGALCKGHARLRARPAMAILPWPRPCLCGHPDLIQNLMFELKDAIMKERNRLMLHWNWNAVERAKHLKPFKKPRAASCCNRCFLNPMVSVKQKGEFVSCLDIFAQEQK